MKKLLSLALSLLMLLNLSACGEGESAQTIQEQSAVSSEVEVEKSEEQPAAETPVKTEESKPANITKPSESKPSESKGTEAAKHSESKPAETPVVSTEKPVEEQKPAVPAAPPAATPAAEETTPVDSSFSIHYIDVGQADAALVECDGHYMLIDGGNKADSSKIYSVLKSAGVSKLDLVVGTHAHEDHIGGLPGAYNYADVELTLCPVENYDSDAFADFKKYAGTLTVPSVGDEYDLGSADVKILGVNGGSDANNSSIVLKVIYEETSFLFTGDAERDAEQAILNRGSDLSATVLKVGHHGSDTSTTYPFLREIMPEHAIISVGKGNSYGHPTDAVLSRLKDAGSKIYRTDLQGDIIVTSDGKNVTVSTSKSASTEALMKAGSGSVPSSKPAATEKPTASAKPAETQKPAATQKPATPAPEVAPAPVGQNYVLNTNTKKFHFPGCKSVKQMKEKNRKDVVSTRENIIAQGYDPCGNCDP